MTKNLSYLSYPLPPDIQRLFEAGDFDRMARVIRQRLEDPRVPKTLHERLRFQLIIAKEIPEYYRLTQADMLAILQENINDFTEDELEALRDDGTLDWRYINGEVHFRNNCLDALLKVRKEYALRAKDPEVQAVADARGQRLNAMITRMKEEGGMHVRFELHEEMTVKSDRLTPGETLRIHLPLPVVGAQVKSAALLSTSHPAAFIAPADEPQRTVYFELPYEPGMTVRKNFFIENDSTWDVYYRLYLDNISGGLADVLTVTVKDGSKIICSGSASELTQQNALAADDTLRIGQRRDLTVEFYFPEDKGNDTQDLDLTFTLCAEATQTKNNPNKLFT